MVLAYRLLLVYHPSPDCLGRTASQCPALLVDSARRWPCQEAACVPVLEWWDREASGCFGVEIGIIFGIPNVFMVNRQGLTFMKPGGDFLAQGLHGPVTASLFKQGNPACLFENFIAVAVGQLQDCHTPPIVLLGGPCPPQIRFDQDICFLANGFGPAQEPIWSPLLVCRMIEGHMEQMGRIPAGFLPLQIGDNPGVLVINRHHIFTDHGPCLLSLVGVRDPVNMALDSAGSRLPRQPCPGACLDEWEVHAHPNDPPNLGTIRSVWEGHCGRSEGWQPSGYPAQESEGHCPETRRSDEPKRRSPV